MYVCVDKRQKLEFGALRIGTYWLIPIFCKENVLEAEIFIKLSEKKNFKVI